MISGVIILSFLMPLQVNGGIFIKEPLFKPVLVGAIVDSARILGLPKYRLRDSSGNTYLPNKALLQEPLALIHKEAGVTVLEAGFTKRKPFISSYIRR
jgi:hypothetical protein